MTLEVDFNLEDDRGRIPALAPVGLMSELQIGGVVVAQDDEGNCCKAYVADLDSERCVAFLAIDLSTWEICFDSGS